MKLTKSLLGAAFTTTVTVLSLSLPLATAHAADVVGDYSVKGVDVNGASYVGKLKVTANGPVFRMTYKDGRTIKGMGILIDTNLFAAWGPSDKCSVSALKIRPDGGLEGPWADLSKNQLGSENMKRQSGAANSVVGTYSGTGMDPDGHAYEGLATVEARGTIFKVTYKSAGETFNGVGVKHGNYLAVSYGGGKCGVTAYTVKGDNTMSGVYAEYGAAKTGTEELTKGW